MTAAPLRWEPFLRVPRQAPACRDTVPAPASIRR